MLRPRELAAAQQVLQRQTIPESPQYIWIPSLGGYRSRQTPSRRRRRQWRHFPVFYWKPI